MKRKYTEPCYYCGAPACSDEHVPPKQMFKGFSCDSITVPSCEDHNNSKGGQDQAIVSAFLIPLCNRTEKYSVGGDILKAINIAKPSFERAKRSAHSIPFLKNPPPTLKDLPNVAYVVPAIDTHAWIRQLTAGLVYDGIKQFDSTIDWSEASVWSPDYMATRRPESVDLGPATTVMKKNTEQQEQLERLNWIKGWAANPTSYPTSIFSFQLSFGLDREIMFRHRFYNHYTWYARFLAAHETVAMLKERLSK
jgi:hypothetical protein